MKGLPSKSLKGIIMQARDPLATTGLTLQKGFLIFLVKFKSDLLRKLEMRRTSWAQVCQASHITLTLLGMDTSQKGT